MVLSRGKEGSGIERSVGLIGGGLVFLLIFAIWPNIVLAFAKVNLNMDPMNYANPNAPANLQDDDPRKVIDCTQDNAAVGYVHTNKIQAQECRAVKFIGLDSSNNIKSAWDTGRMLVGGIGGALVVLGAVMFRLEKQKTPKIA